ncbi:MAG: hypothetical protein NWQ68_03270 [Ilumatobacteraceae bacterium]|nr:hypothetical protein [Ilumatobacteraceae bacterium]MDP4704985.1 hypothetical protein [Ilumatobacteraceae bacterium]MDP4712591.1 hypothetical protein [Ilumatobacteraceae bacterium]MDP4936408.1 hypothetical protein [Ilumatobacteraceae bacterium]
MRQSADRGNASILMMGVLALSFSWILALVTVTQNLTASLSAQTVADAVVLAALEDGDKTARQLAELNEARLISLVFYNAVGQGGEIAVAVIEIDGVQAQATASSAP